MNNKFYYLLCVEKRLLNYKKGKYVFLSDGCQEISEKCCMIKAFIRRTKENIIRCKE